MGDSRIVFVLGLFVILLGSPFTANLGFSQEILFETTFDGQPNRSGDAVRAVIAGDFEIDLPVVVTDVHFFILDQADRFDDVVFFTIYSNDDGNPGAPIPFASGSGINVSSMLFEESGCADERITCKKVWFDLPTDIFLPPGTYWIGLSGQTAWEVILDLSGTGLPDKQSFDGGSTWGTFGPQVGMPFALTGFNAGDTIDIDIKPGSDPNAIQPFKMGVTPVVILSSSTFSAETVDFSTVTFGPDEATPVHKKPHLEDVNNDGLDDMVVHFKTKEIGIEQVTTELCLKALTFGGTSIEGCDAIVVVPKS